MSSDSVGPGAAQRRDRANEIRHVPAIEDGSGVQHARLAVCGGLDGRAIDARHNRVDPLLGHAEMAR